MSEILRFNFVFQDRSRNIQVAAEKNTGKLIARCYGFFGMEDTVPDFRWDYTMDEGDWEKLMYIIEDAHAAKWESGYIDQSVENAPEWSLEIHILGKHTISEGYNKYPKEFESFKEDLLDFLRMKRRQLHPGLSDFRNFALAQQNGLECPIVLADKMEKTFTFYNLFENIEHDGSYFMNDGDWEAIEAVLTKHQVFKKFENMPDMADAKADRQCSVSVGYKPGQITQRYTGYEPGWWAAFSKDIFDLFTRFYNEGRKSAEGNFGSLVQ